jgi:hypothetical protein
MVALRFSNKKTAQRFRNTAHNIPVPKLSGRVDARVDSACISLHLIAESLQAWTDRKQ